MDEKSLYAYILNLSAPWQVKSRSLDENAGSFTVTVRIAENTRYDYRRLHAMLRQEGLRLSEKVVRWLMGKRPARLATTHISR